MVKTRKQADDDLEVVIDGENNRCHDDPPFLDSTLFREDSDVPPYLTHGSARRVKPSAPAILIEFVSDILLSARAWTIILYVATYFMSCMHMRIYRLPSCADDQETPDAVLKNGRSERRALSIPSNLKRAGSRPSNGMPFLW